MTARRRYILREAMEMPPASYIRQMLDTGRHAPAMGWPRPLRDMEAAV